MTHPFGSHIKIGKPGRIYVDEKGAWLQLTLSIRINMCIWSVVQATFYDYVHNKIKDMLHMRNKETGVIWLIYWRLIEDIATDDCLTFMEICDNLSPVTKRMIADWAINRYEEYARAVEEYLTDKRVAYITHEIWNKVKSGELKMVYRKYPEVMRLYERFRDLVNTYSRSLYIEEKMIIAQEMDKIYRKIMDYIRKVKLTVE